MSVSVQFDEDEVFQLASASGWAVFGRWAETVPYESVKQFADGGVDDTRKLALELEDAIERYPPPEQVAKTVLEFQELLGVGDEKEFAKVLM